VWKGVFHEVICGGGCGSGALAASVLIGATYFDLASLLGGAGYGFLAPACAGLADCFDLAGFVDFLIWGPHQGLKLILSLPTKQYYC
jgi:hypothetical protein